LGDPSYRKSKTEKKNKCNTQKKKCMRFGRTKQASRKTLNNDRCEKYKQSQCNFEQIKNIEMVDQRQSQDKKMYL